MTEKKINDLSLQALESRSRSPVPLYHQIEENLREVIRRGELAPGDLLPTDVELAEFYKVGRHTVRMALNRLADDGLLERKAGKGTIVSPQQDRMQFYLDRSFTSQMAEMGRVARSQVLEVALGQIDRNAPKVFQNKIGAPYMHLSRLRFGDQEPIGLQDTLLLTERCPGIEKHNFNTSSLYDVLLNFYKLAITEIAHTVSATVANHQLARLLDVREGDPLLVVKIVAFVERHQIIEFTTSHYRADRYEYSITHMYPG